MIEPGKYPGLITGYGVRFTANGDPMATVKFHVKGTDHYVFWQGVMVGGGVDITLKALVAMGLNSTEDLAKVADGPEGAALDIQNAVELDIIHELNQKGERVPRVQWVNKMGSMKNQITSSTFAHEIEKRDLKARLAKILQSAGAPAQKEEPAVNLEDIPF